MMKVKGIVLLSYLLIWVSPALGDEVSPLDTIEKSAKEKKFTGSPITLKLKDADVNEVMRLIGEASGFSVVVAPGVSGKVTVSLEEVPWDQALDVVMTTMNLAAERSESVLRIMPREVLLKEKQAILETERIASQTAPRITRVFPISYADLTQLATLLGGFLSTPQAGAAAGAPGQAGGGQAAPAGGVAGGVAGGAVAPLAISGIQIDQNTQSLIVRDTVEAVERIRKMIALLDVQTPQIMIDAKVIAANKNFERNIKGGLDLTSGPNGFLNAGNLAGSAPTGQGASGGFKLGIGGTYSLNAALDYGETESSAKVVSSPSLIVLNGKTASVLQGGNLSVEQVTQTGGVTVTNRVFIPVNTSLKVTPRATNDGSVFMKLDLERDVVQNLSGGAAKSPRNISTEVVVDSGKTLVLGGVLGTDESTQETGFPFLRKIPLLGWLFGSETQINGNSELIFFVTPRIVNVKKTALGDGGVSEQKPEKL
ncbi:MAG: hypothetical protein KGP28_04250 [Bdellovibrionales bacterium]|nr:hypothetical protein [Bdellovibrionales bacterium]